MTEAEFLAEVGELLKLVEGLESGTITCSCRRIYKVGISAELKRLLPRVRREYLRRTGAAPETAVADSSRFALIEVD